MRLSLRSVDKSFGVTRALENVSFDVRAGAVHALLGENGAGKSTLMKVVAGALRPDSGSLLLDGEAFDPTEPSEARRRGVAIVYQELSVCPHLSVAENILLGVEPRRFGFISKRAQNERAARALSPLLRGRASFALDATLGSLAAGDRQLVEIARALAAENPRLLILDEPTSSLSGDAVARLFAAIRELREQGIAILYISHFLEEVRQIADDYTVLCDGRHVQSGRVADTTNDGLVMAMAGRAIAPHERHPRERGEVALRVKDLAGERLPLAANLRLHRGEVLGIAGLVGSGRSELLRCIFGLEQASRGEVSVGNRPTAGNPRRRLAESVGLLSEDRKGEGLALGLSVSQNMTLSKLSALTRHGLLSATREREVSQHWIARLGIRCRDGAQRIAELSGGNQQKVALGRLLFHDVDVLLLDEPTRGIDVRSRAEIHALIQELAERGKAVLLVSSQLPELFAVCDRIAVMHRGVLGEARPVNELSEHDLLLEATGA